MCTCSIEAPKHYYPHAASLSNADARRNQVWKVVHRRGGAPGLFGSASLQYGHLVSSWGQSADLEAVGGGLAKGAASAAPFVFELQEALIFRHFPLMSAAPERGIRSIALYRSRSVHTQSKAGRCD